MTQSEQQRDLILHRPERAIADEFGITVEQVQAILDEHPIEKDRERYLRRALAQQLLLLDRLEVTFGEMAFADRDTAAGALLVKVAERRATLLGLNPPLGHAVAIVQPPSRHEQQPDEIDRMNAALDRIAASRPKPDEPDCNDRGELH